jgi:hypothetical protein
VRSRLHRPPSRIGDSGSIRAAVPMTLADDEALFEAAWRVLKPEGIKEGRMLIVENPLHLEELWLSEVLLEEVEARENVEAVGEPFPLEFDPGGHLVLQIDPYNLMSTNDGEAEGRAL